VQHRAFMFGFWHYFCMHWNFVLVENVSGVDSAEWIAC
jgi:hypothetical protein